MEINKQLFEDVLSGKLEGTFVLRNKIDIETNVLVRNVSNSYYVFPYKIYNRTYTENGLMLKSMLSEYDIIDFIPNTNMKENELTIKIPDGKTVDWDESKKQSKIVFKDKQLTYEDICNKLFVNNNAYYTNVSGLITYGKLDLNRVFDPNNATTAHQLECLLAKNKLANVAKYLNDGWKPKSGEEYYTLVCDRKNKKIINSCKSLYCDIGDFIFKSHELAQQAIEILGEETVKLALEPLGV